MPAANSDMDKLKSLSQRVYGDQAKWFLNAYYNDHDDATRNQIWEYTHKMIEVDEKKGKSGNELEEFFAHRFLEIVDNTLTVTKMREVLREIDLDFNKFVSLTEFLVYKYDSDWKYLVNAPQSDNKEEIDKAVRLVEQALASVQAAQEAKAKALQAENEARQKVQAARQAEEAQKRDEAAVRDTLAELQSQEKAFQDKKRDLEHKSSDAGGLGLVARNKASHELQQLLAEDPLPLRKAKINQEAAVRAAEKTTKIAVKAREEADAAAKRAEEARLDAEAAVVEAENNLQKAEAYLQEVKSKPGSGKGAIWWLEKEMSEARKYLPQSKGGVAK